MEVVILTKIKFDKLKYISLSFLLSFLIVTIIYIILGIYPFGENVILKIDLYHQYAPFHEELRNRILNGQSLFYSWEGGLGKEFISQLAYYTASPISLLILLFSQNNLPEAIAFFILLKIALSSASFAYYLKNSFNKNNLTVVIFSIMYSLSAFVTSYYWNVMWLDAVVLFPIIALGIERLVNEDKHITYFISITLVIIVNFYIAFLVCVFSVLYFLVVVLSKYSIRTEKKIIIKRAIKFGFLSLLGGGISMFLTIPTAVALSHTAASDSTFPKFKLYDNIYQLITNHFVGARPVILGRNEDLPNVYTGIFTMLLFPLYFFNKNFKLKEKILYLILILFIFACSSINVLDYLIHGMHFPSNLPHRFTFIYSFIILILAYKALLNIDKVNFKIIYFIFAFYVLIILSTQYILVPLIKDIDKVLSKTDIIINIAAMLFYIVLLHEYKSAEGKHLNKITILLLCAVFAESSFSCYTGMDYNGVTKREKYVKYIPDTENILNYVKENDKDFHRIEFNRFTTINDPSLYHYNGFSQFSSLAYGDTSKLIENLGIAATSNSYRYYDPTPLINAMFNIKYIMNKDSKLSNKNYEYIYNENNVYLYKNDYCLSLGFMVNKNIENWNTDLGNPFDVQNDFIYTAADIDKNMMEKIKIDDFDYENIKIKSVQNDIYKYDLEFPNDIEKIPIVTASVKNPVKQHVFLYVDSSNSKRFEYTVEGKNKQDRELSAGRSLIDVGIVDAGKEIKISFKLDRKGEFEKTFRKSGKIKLYAAGFNKDVFEEAYNRLDKEKLDIYEYNDTSVKGNVNASKDGILFTSIPYDKGWSVFIDGEKSEIIPIAGNGLIGLNITQGEHDITFQYKAQGFNLGCIISIFSLLIFIFYNIILKKQKNLIN